MKESRDILTLFEALSNHEVFTPPRIARQLLDLLPNETWKDPKIKVLDPCAKSGVFLRECFFRFQEGLSKFGTYTSENGEAYDLNDPKIRTEHILKNMLYGISISELTGYVSRRTLYGVMEANTDKQLAAIESFETSENFKTWTEEQKWNFVGKHKFNQYYNHKMFCTPEHAGFEAEGNIFYPSEEVNKIAKGDSAAEEKYYPFIVDGIEHAKINEIKSGKMKFDIIIGNPPYQIRDGGHAASASPIYQKFVQAAKSLSPRYISFIIPSRWFSGGKGLDVFRSDMLSDTRIKNLIDYPDATDCFPGILLEGGVCIFLWDAAYKGNCRIKTIAKGISPNEILRPLKNGDIFVRFNQAISILEKVQAINEPTMDLSVSSRKPFGLSTNFREYSNEYSQNSIKLYARGEVGWASLSKITQNKEDIPKWKVLIGAAYGGGGVFPHQITGKPVLAEPYSACTETYLIFSSHLSEKEAKNSLKYLQSKFTRFLISLRKSAQHLSKERFSFVPQQDWSKEWTDSALYEKYKLTPEEIAFIDSIVKDM